MKRALIIFFRLSFSCAMLLLGSCSEDEPVPAANGKLFINEVFATGVPDWLELYNAGDEDIDLSGYFIYDDVLDKYTLPSGTSIAGNGYLVLNCDGLASGLSTNFRLSAAGETITLESPSTSLIDELTYPAIPNGASYGRFTDGTANLQISGIPTRGASNGESGAVAIQLVDHSPQVVTVNDDVTISATLTSTNSIAIIEVLYSIDNVTQSPIVMTGGAGNIYTATIAALTTGGEVSYSVKVVDSADNEVVLSGFSYLVNNDVLPNLVINEFLASNDACCPDNDGAFEEFDDWVEIYNPGATDVNIAGFYLSDDPLNSFLYKIPNTNAGKTTVAAGGYLLLWADKDLLQGENHLEFKLSSFGESIGLYYVDGRTIDEYTFGAQTKNVSEGRQTDAANTWVNFTTPTPLSTNN